MRPVQQMSRKEVYKGSVSPQMPVRNPHGYSMMRTLETSGDELLVQQKNIYKQLKSNALDKMATEEYQPAVYSKALQYRNRRSYMKKIDGSYKQIGLFTDTQELRYFGVGVYFYIEFFRRLCWLFLVMTLIQSICIYINYMGVGLNNYSLSFSSYLIKTTLGNYSGSVLTTDYDGLIVALTPAASYIAMFLFYLIWKCHFFRTITSQQEDMKDVKPEKFCIEVVGLPQEYVHQDDLQRFFSSFGPVYQVSVVRNYENKLPYFHELDQLEEEIKEQELELVLGGDDSNRKSIAKHKSQKAKLEKQLNNMQIKPTTVSAFVHFQFEKSKVQCLSYFNNHYLFDKCSHSCARTCFCCCVDQPDERAIFQNKKIMVSTDKPPAPEDINWQSYELGCCGYLIRVIFAFLIILIFLAISCTIIGICGIYISSHSNNCDSIDTSIYTASSATATGDSNIIRCYCNANLVASFTDNSIQAACSSYLKDIYIEQAIQYVILITQAITNVIFGLIVDKLVNCMRPFSKANGLYLKTVLFTIFLCLNTVVIPVLIYADIFGFQPSSYVSFLTIISTDITNFLAVTNLSFYPSFTNVWYRNVSPLFTNYMVFNTIGVWLVYIFYRCCCISKDELQEDQRKILQKTMNRKITDFTLDVYKEASNLYLIVIMAMLFCAGIPAMLPLAMLNIVSRYIVNRSLLQTYSTKIDGLGEQFSSLTLWLLAFILIFFPLIGEWMLVSNSYIYPSGLSISFTFLDFLKGNFTQLDMQLYLPFYLIISVVALAELVIYFSIIRFCACLCNLCYEKKEVQYHSRPFTEYTKSLNILCSYNVRHNDSMRNAILHLEKYLISKE